MRVIKPGQSAPRRPIHAALPGGCGALGLKRGNRGGLWQAIQRHIHQRGVTAGRCGAGSGGEAFPFCPARFIHVDMRIHQAGQQHHVAELMQLGCARCVFGGEYCLNASLLDHDRRRPYSVGCDHAAGDKDLCHILRIFVQPCGECKRNEHAR